MSDPFTAADRDGLHAEYDGILTRQGNLLTAAVNALRGDPPPLASWSHHDVADLAQAMRHRAETAEAKVALIEALASEWESDRDVCLAWIQDPSKHLDTDHPMRLSGMADLLNNHAIKLRTAVADPAPAPADEPNTDTGR